MEQPTTTSIPSRRQNELEIASLNTAQPRNWENELSFIPRRLLRQILGLNPFKTSYFALYRPLKSTKARLLLFLAVCLSLLAGIPLPVIGVVFGKIINNFPPSEDELRTRVGQLLGVASGFLVVTWGWAACWGIIGELVSRGLREAVFERALSMEQSFYDVQAPDMTGMLTEKTQTIQLGTSEKVGLFISSISYFVAAFTVGFILDARLTGILLAAVIPLMAVIVCFGSHTVSRFAKAASECAENASRLAESAIKGVHVVQAFGIQDILDEQHLQQLRIASARGIRKSLAGAIMLGSVFLVAYAANALAFYLGHEERKGSGTDTGNAGTVYAVVFLIMDASFVVGQFGPFIQTFASAAAAGEKIFALLDQPEPHIDIKCSNGRQMEELDATESIRFEHVTFVYPARDMVRVLKGLDLELQAGSVNGIVGSSGSGKSTIASLLMRIYDPSSGRVTVNGRDLRDFNVRSLRSRMAVVDQTPVLFSGTIFDNIRHGLKDNAEFNEEQVQQLVLKAAQDAHCDFLERLPQGLHTLVGSSGLSQLSGGQKQRICLARALVGNPSLLILDEFTSAMDATSEAIVLQNLKRSSSESGRTTVIIAHRLATVKEADKIMVLHDGVLLEEGSHEDLLDSNGAYSRLVESQKFERSPSISNNGSSSTVSKTSAKDTDVEKETTWNLGALLPAENTPGETARMPNLSVVHILRRCISMAKPKAFLMILGLTASIVCGGIVLGEAAVFGNLVQVLNSRTITPAIDQQADLFCLLFFVLSLIALFGHSIAGSSFGVVSEHVILRIKQRSLQAILQQDIQWFSDPGHSADTLLGVLSTDAGHLSSLSGVIVGTLLTVTTSVMGGIILAHAVAWKIAIVLLAAVPVMLLAGFLRLRVLALAEQRQRTAYLDSAAFASEACSAIRTVAALGMEDNVFDRYRRSLKAPFDQSIKFALGGNVLLAFSLSVTYFVYALAFWWGSKQVRDGNYTQLQFFIVLPALLFSAQAAGQMFSLAPEITRAWSAAQSVFRLLDLRPSIITDEDKSAQRSPAPPDLSEKVAAISHGRDCHKGRLQIRDVSLVYPSRPDQIALNDISLNISAGEFVAFVGRSGAGKSSTVALIERFYDPSKGTVLLDGEDIRDRPVQLHRDRLGLVEQEPHIFPGSVAFNVGLGAGSSRSVSQAAIESVCKECGLHEFVMSLPEGYNTDCGHNGDKLSGGQRQRVAIARALIRDPEILLLDEATSQLDAHSEQEVRRAIAAASSGRTTIVVAHRLASVQHADCIYVFDQGTVAEQGKHDALVAVGGIYANMVRNQELG